MPGGPTAESTEAEGRATLTLNHAAARLGVSPEMVRRWAAEGLLRLSGDDGRVGVPAGEVARLRAALGFADAPAAPSAPGDRAPRILVVDDDPDICDVIAAALADEGYLVDVAANGGEALARFAAHPPALLVLDVMMPDMNGWELAERLRADEAAVPIIFTSAAERIYEAARHHAVAFLPKPFDLDRLVTVVTEALMPVTPE